MWRCRLAISKVQAGEIRSADKVNRKVTFARQPGQPMLDAIAERVVPQDDRLTVQQFQRGETVGHHTLFRVIGVDEDQLATPLVA